MENPRSSIFGDDFDVSDIKPKSIQRPSKEITEKAAEAAKFPSREPKNVSKIQQKDAEKLQRRRRTGRNAQLNLKAKPETIEAFYQIADVHGWGLGETLEKAVSLMQKHLG